MRPICFLFFPKFTAHLKGMATPIAGWHTKFLSPNRCCCSEMDRVLAARVRASLAPLSARMVSSSSDSFPSPSVDTQAQQHKQM